MKFKAIFYPLICVAIVFAIASFLVVKNNIDKSRSQKPQTQQVQQINDENLPPKTDDNSQHKNSGETTTNDSDKNQRIISDNDDNDNTTDRNKLENPFNEDNADDDDKVLPIEPKQEFAKDLKLNCNSTIEMAINETVVLKDYLTVEPKKFFNATKITITNGNESTNNLTFKNGTISATKIGCYKICFSINVGKTEIKTEVLTIIVKEKCSYIELKTNKLELGKTYSVDDIINNKTAGEVSLNFDKKYLRFKNNKLTTLKAGSTIIEICVTNENMFCYFDFDIIIFKPTVCKIVLPDYANKNKIETNKNMLGINYQIMYGDAEYVDQTILAELSDESVARIMFSDAPMIYIKKLSKGSVTLKLTSVADPTITKTIVIVFN